MFICIYSNCQGTIGLKYFLKKFTPNYNIYCISNYSLINAKESIPVKELNNADVFIYQPIDKVHGIYSTDDSIENNITSYLTPKCLKISFPYIYFPPIFTINTTETFGVPHNFDLSLLGINFDKNQKFNNISTESKKLFNSGFIDIINKFNLYDRNIEKIINDYDDGKLNFDFENRFNFVIKNLKEREINTNIKIVDYILENYKNKILFLSHNHPTSYILIHIINQIYGIIEPDKKIITKQNLLLNEANIPDMYDIILFDSYNYNFYNFDFKNEDELINIINFDEIIKFYKIDDSKTKHFIRNKLIF